MRRYCGWHITPEIEETIILDGRGGEDVLIPTTNLVALIACTSDGQDVLADVDPSTKGILSRRTGHWSLRNSGISITIKHGYESAPDVAGLIASIASRAVMNPGGNIVNQRAGTQSLTLATSGGASASIPLMATEKELLEPYRLNWGP
ncbi:hypothetical protein AL755_08520 [Arthrobacter sp. ERGS1:01]|nr:hypothetical protein AL755_08520 [Arthrobacter sp. ERGS1:01]